MIRSGIFVDLILPACIVTGLACFLLYTVLSRFLYDYVDRHYADMLEKPAGVNFVDSEGMGSFMGSVWFLTRSGRYRHISSKPIRLLFLVNAGIGALLILSTLIICGAFLPHPWH